MLSRSRVKTATNTSQLGPPICRACCSGVAATASEHGLAESPGQCRTGNLLGRVVHQSVGDASRYRIRGGPPIRRGCGPNDLEATASLGSWPTNLSGIGSINPLGIVLPAGGKRGASGKVAPTKHLIRTVQLQLSGYTLQKVGLITGEWPPSRPANAPPIRRGYGSTNPSGMKVPQIRQRQGPPIRQG
jgi:hypothetical protein